MMNLKNTQGFKLGILVKDAFMSCKDVPSMAANEIASGLAARGDKVPYALAKFIANNGKKSITDYYKSLKGNGRVVAPKTIRQRAKDIQGWTFWK